MHITDKHGQPETIVPQLTGSFNASLKDYLKSDLNVAQFFSHFKRVVNDKRYKELEAEYFYVIG